MYKTFPVTRFGCYSSFYFCLASDIVIITIIILDKGTTFNFPWALNSSSLLLLENVILHVLENTCG